MVLVFLPKYGVIVFVAQLCDELEMLASTALAPIGICEGWVDLMWGHLFCVLMDTTRAGTICAKFFQVEQLHKTHETSKPTLQQMYLVPQPVFRTREWMIIFVKD